MTLACIRTKNYLREGNNILRKKQNEPWPCGSVGWASSPGWKGCWLNSDQGTCPG